MNLATVFVIAMILSMIAFLICVYIRDCRMTEHKSKEKMQRVIIPLALMMASSLLAAALAVDRQNKPLDKPYDERSFQAGYEKGLADRNK